MPIIEYASTKLHSLGKEGKITCDADGYYEIIIGAFNIYNSAGEFYTYQGVSSLFEDNSLFQRRVRGGNLKGEMGHPKRQPGQNDESYIDRMFIVEEKSEAVHYRKIKLDTDYGKKNPHLNNPSLVGVIAELRPSGFYGPALKDALDNKWQNVCFSLRGFTKDNLIRGEVHRTLESIVTWDVVIEPGLAVATKWDSPSLESADVTQVNTRTLEKLLNQRKIDGLAKESSSVLMLDLYDKVKRPEIITTSSGWLNKVNKTGNSVIAKW